VRANIVLYFAISTVITTTVYLAGGLLTPSVVGLALVTGPIYGVGLYAGAKFVSANKERKRTRISQGSMEPP